MPIVGLFNKEGQRVGDFTLSEEIFGFPVNAVALHQVVVAQLANKRQGTQSAKTRAEVSGGGKKPWKQKGTGNARQGSTRSPQWVKGGIVFAPKPRDYSIKLPKSLRRVALKSALSSKVEDNEMMVLDNIDLDIPNTKKIVSMLNVLNVKKALILVAEKNDNAYKSARNIPGISLVPVNNINVYDLLKYDYLIATKDAVSIIEEVYSK